MRIRKKVLLISLFFVILILLQLGDLFFLNLTLHKEKDSFLINKFSDNDSLKILISLDGAIESNDEALIVLSDSYRLRIESKFDKPENILFYWYYGDSCIAVHSVKLLPGTVVYDKLRIGENNLIGKWLIIGLREDSTYITSYKFRTIYK